MDDLTKGNLDYQWTLWGTFEIPKVNFLKTELEYNSSEISITEWYPYFNGYFEASKCCQEPVIASLQNKISKSRIDQDGRVRKRGAHLPP